MFFILIRVVLGTGGIIAVTDNGVNERVVIGNDFNEYSARSSRGIAFAPGSLVKGKGYAHYIS